MATITNDPEEVWVRTHKRKTGGTQRMCVANPRQGDMRYIRGDLQFQNAPGELKAVLIAQAQRIRELEEERHKWREEWFWSRREKLPGYPEQ